MTSYSDVGSYQQFKGSYCSKFTVEMTVVMSINLNMNNGGIRLRET
jgi:hypothetical protein